ncbi:MAG: sulfatase [Planctomycetota bacterium]|nr:sulfatase [Planctomycetota bacterium]
MPAISRRSFLKWTAAGAALAAADCRSALAAEAALAAKRPNFIFILSDDQRWDAMSVVQREQGTTARFPWLKTPNLDRIAAEGVRFRNAFVVNSLCAPSRASFLTGCYGHVNGIVNNHTPFSESNMTHASVLRGAGYATGYVGKWHMGSQRERPGFDFAASFIGQGKYFDCPFVVNGAVTESKGWIDDVSTDYAVEFLRRSKDKPFLLVVGYKTTHGPFTPPERRQNTYEGEEARPAPNLDAKAAYRSEAAAKNLRPGEAPGVRTNLGYFRCITAMDDNVGRILKTLDDLGLAEDTMVVFAGDNGYYLGEHGLGDKRSAYDESLRIPLLVRYPRLGVKDKRVDEMVLNTDLAPTFIDYSGAEVKKVTHGRSWRPLLEGKAAEWRRAFFYCYFYERGFSTPMVTAVRTETAKLIKYPGHDEWTEMFDLAADPYELKNLYADPAKADLRRELEAEYDKQAAAIAFCVPEFADKPGEPGEPKAKAKGKAKKG